MTTTSYSVEGVVIESLCIADAGVLRQEEPVQQRVDPEQPGAGQRDSFGVALGQKTFRLQRVQLSAETIERIYPVLVLKVPGLHRPAFQLEDELANQPLIGVGPVGTAERQVAGFNRRRVLLPGVDVLKVNAVDVPE